jgi:hypothetical protein
MPPWLSWLLGAIVVVGFLGSVTIYLRGSKDAGTIQTLERSNQALNERVAILEANESRLSARVTLLEHENAELHAQRPSAEMLVEMRSLLEQHVEELRHHDMETRPLLMAIAAQLQELTDARQ